MSWEWASLALALLLILAALSMGHENQGVPKTVKVCAGKLTSFKFEVKNPKQVFATLFGEGVIKVVKAKGVKVSVFIPKPGKYELKITVVSEHRIKNYLINVEAVECSAAPQPPHNRYVG